MKKTNRYVTLIIILILISQVNIYAYNNDTKDHIYCNKNIACGNGFTAVLKSDGTVWYWGRDIVSPTLNSSDRYKTDSLKRIDPLTGIVSIAVGGFDNLLALKSNGTVWVHSKGTVKKVEGLADIIDIAVSINHYLALKKDGSVWSWGNNQYGALGDGTTINRDNPMPIKGLNGVRSIAADAEKSIVIKKDGTVWFFGTIRVPRYDMAGHIQTDSTTQPVPEKIEGLSDIVEVSTQTASPVSNMHFLALKNDETVWSWGSNQFGQVNGDSEELFYSEPRLVEGVSDIISIADGVTDCYAIGRDGALWAWGGKHHKIEKIMPTSNLISVHAGMDHYVSLDKGGKIWIWGESGSFDALGSNDITESDIPILCNINIPVGNIYDSEIKVVLDGRLLIFDVRPKITNGRTLVPIRAIAEALDLEVRWDPVTKIIHVKNDEKDVILKINDKIVLINGKPTEIDVAPNISNGRTLVPLRFISEVLGSAVEWDSDTRLISITKN